MGPPLIICPSLCTVWCSAHASRPCPPPLAPHCLFHPPPAAPWRSSCAPATFSANWRTASPLRASPRLPGLPDALPCPCSWQPLGGCMRPGGPPNPRPSVPHLHQQLDIGVIALGRAAVHPLVAATGLEVDALRTGGSAVQHKCKAPRGRAIGPQGPSSGACCIAGGGSGSRSAVLLAPVGCLALLGASKPRRSPPAPPRRSMAGPTWPPHSPWLPFATPAAPKSVKEACRGPRRTP